jgi:DNA-binding transcriptional regulator YiaG
MRATPAPLITDSAGAWLLPVLSSKGATLVRRPSRYSFRTDQWALRERRQQRIAVATLQLAGYRRMMMTPAECLAARSLLHWSQLQLADASGADVTAIRNYEDGTLAPNEANVEALRRAFEVAGVQFVTAIGGGSGVRLV